MAQKALSEHSTIRLSRDCERSDIRVVVAVRAMYLSQPDTLLRFLAKHSVSDAWNTSLKPTDICPLPEP